MRSARHGIRDGVDQLVEREALHDDTRGGGQAADLAM